MPQIHLEYSENCKPKEAFAVLFEKLHAALATIGGINLDNCKSRAICQQNYFIADGHASHAFVHLSIRFVEGRSEATKNMIGSTCLEHLQTFFSEQINYLNLQITVEIRDIILADYHKYPEGTLTRQA